MHPQYRIEAGGLFCVSRYCNGFCLRSGARLCLKDRVCSDTWLFESASVACPRGYRTTSKFAERQASSVCVSRGRHACWHHRLQPRMPRADCRDNTPGSMRRSCTHSIHAQLSTVPAWLFFVCRLFQFPDGSDTHLIESASCPIGLRQARGEAGQLVVYFVPACRFIGCGPNAERRLET